MNLLELMIKQEGEIILDVQQILSRLMDLRPLEEQLVIIKALAMDPDYWVFGGKYGKVDKVRWLKSGRKLRHAAD